MKRGFTLIELLAVIVILAIIALIAVPIVINIINDSKKESIKRSIELYIGHAQKMIAKEQMKDPTFNPSECEIKPEGILECKNETKTYSPIKIEMKGQRLEEGILYFNNGKVESGRNLKINGKYYQIESNGNIKEEYNDVIGTYISIVKGSVGNITGICYIGINKVTCNGIETALPSGQNATKGTIVFNSGEVISYKNVLINGTYYHESNGNKTTSQTEKYTTLVSDTGETGISIGDKYTYQVNETDEFNFYILSIEGEGENQKVNLIMDRNICNNGSATYTRANNYCRYEWHTGSGDNNYGPDTAMKQLYEGTKGWTNVPNMVMNYSDEENTDSDTMGYTNIITNSSTNITVIMGKQNKTSDSQTFGSIMQPLKARLPKLSEVTKVKCTTSGGSCPVWLVENLKYWDGENGKYSVNNNSEDYQNHYGYWLLSSVPGYSTNARGVYFSGGVSNLGTTNSNSGIRPVITVLKSDLE